MRKRYNLMCRIGLHTTLLCFCSLVGVERTFADTNHSPIIVAEQPQGESPLKIQVTLNVKNLTTSQFINELQKKVGNKAFFNMPTDGVDNSTATISYNGKSTIEEILDDVLLRRNLKYTLKGNVFMITKNTNKIFPQVSFVVVEGKNNKPVPGATLVVKGTSRGAISDDLGKAILKDIREGAEVEITSTGFNDAKVFVKSATQAIIIKMEPKIYGIDDVVVTGYQVQDKRMSTSATTTLRGEDALEPNKVTIDGMLQGKVAGMSVMNTSSTVGAAPKIRIRGSSSIIGSREPVWVIDGIIMDDPVPLDPTQLNSPDKINLVGNAISSLNPQDIERIDILKDASATAIYGIKAANGVIVITTKRGKKGEPSIRYSTSINVLDRPKTSQMFLMNSKERIEVSEEIHARGLEFRGGFVPKGLGYEGALLELWDGDITENQFHQRVKALKETNTDWYKELFRNSLSHSHTLSVSGATDVVNYYFSLGYTNQNGTPRAEEGDRLNFMSNIDINISKRFTARMSLSASRSTDQRPHSSIDLNKYAYYTAPSIPIRNEDGTDAFYATKSGYQFTPDLTYSILNELKESGQSNRMMGFNTNLNLNYKVTDWLSWGAIASYNTSSSNNEEFFTERSFAASELRGVAYGFPLPSVDDFVKSKCELPFGGVINTSDVMSHSYNGRTSLNFNKTIAEKHSISADAGIEFRSTNYRGTDEDVYGYFPERGKNFAVIDYSTWIQYGKDDSQRVPKYTDTRTNTMSYYGTASYGYDYRYIVNANVRGDASNRLGMDKSTRFLPIWSFSGRWNIDREAFLESAEWLNGLAIRGSYGLQGNVTEAHNPNMLIRFGSVDSKSQEYEAYLSSLPNRGLLWEKTRSFNLGLEFSLFKGALRGDVDYYNKIGRDQLISAQVAPANGGTVVTVNAGDIENKGWELTLSATPIKTRNVTWDISVNTSKNINKVTSQGEIPYTYGDYTSGTVIRSGKAVNSFYSYQFKGLDNTGWPTFYNMEAKDADGNLLASKEIAFANAFRYSGKREADLTAGFNTTVRYKWVSFSALFYLSVGAKTRLNRLFQNNDFKLPFPHENMQEEFVNRWRKPGDEAYTNIPALTDRVASLKPDGPIRDTYYSIWQMYDNADMRVISSNFLRCRSMSMSISIPESITNKIYCKNASLSLNVSNPFVIKSKELKGRDPEQIDLGSGILPPLRTYSVSLSLSF